MPSYIELDKQALFPSSSNVGKLILGVSSSGQATLTDSDGITTPIGGGGSIDTSSFATTGSNTFIGNQVITGSVTSTQGFIKPGAGSQYLLADGSTTAGTGGSPFPYTGNAQITGSLNVSGSITGSLFGTASWATSASWAPNAGPIEVYNNVSDFGTLYSTAPGAAGGTTNITQSIVFGWNAGQDSNNIDAVNFLGNRAGRFSQNVQNSNFFGYEAGRTTSASRSNFLGGFTGRLATNASDSNFLGYSAGDQASAASNSNFLGYQAGFRATSASNSNFIGRLAGQYAASASFSTLIGHQVGFETTATPSNSIGSNNIIIGTNITLAAQQRDSINLGGIIFATGSYATTTGNPFSGSMPSSRVGIATTTPQYTLDVNGSGNFTSNLIATGSILGQNATLSGEGRLTIYNTYGSPLLTLSRPSGQAFTNFYNGDDAGTPNRIDSYNTSYLEINNSTQLRLSTVGQSRLNVNQSGTVTVNPTGSLTGSIALQVSGSTLLSGSLGVAGSVGVTGSLTTTGNITSAQSITGNFVYGSNVQPSTAVLTNGQGNSGMRGTSTGIGTSGGVRFFSTNSGGFTFSSGSFTTEARELVRINLSGSVGIGTSTPQFTLDVSGSTRINDILILEPRSTTPDTPTNGMVIVSGSGVDQHIYCYLNSTWKQLDN